MVAVLFFKVSDGVGQDGARGFTIFLRGDGRPVPALIVVVFSRVAPDFERVRVLFEPFRGRVNHESGDKEGVRVRFEDQVAGGVISLPVACSVRFEPGVGVGEE